MSSNMDITHDGETADNEVVETATAVEKLESLLERFTNCEICYSYLVQATECSECNKLFCKLCIEAWFRSTRSRSCPSCRKQSQPVANKPIQRLVDQIPLTCAYKVNGCNHYPPRKDFQLHVTSCEYKNRVINNHHTQANFCDRTAHIHAMIHQNPITAKVYISQMLNNIINDVADNGMRCELNVRMADCLAVEGKYDEANVCYNNTLQSLIASHGENHELVISCYAGLGFVNKKLANYDQATTSLQKAIQIAKTLGGDFHPEIIPQMITIGDILRKNGNFDQAETAYVEAIAKIQRVHDQDINGQNANGQNANGQTTTSPIQLATACRGLGMIYKKKADYDNALKWHTQAVNTLTTSLQTNNSSNGHHMELGNCLIDLGDIYRKREQNGEALATYSQALNHLTATSGNKSVDVAEVYYCQSLSYLALRKDKECFEAIEKAKLILEAHYKSGHYKLGMVRAVMAKVYSLRQDYQTAHNLFEMAINMLVQQLGPDHLEVADAKIDLVDCVLKQMSETGINKLYLQSAIEHINAARAIYAKQFGAQHTKIDQCDSRLYILQHPNDF